MNAFPRTRRAAGFTLIEIVVAVGITVLIAGFIVALLANVSGFWSRTAGRVSAESQARFVLDQLTLDLQSALYRDDGATWLGATVQANTTGIVLWNNAQTTGNAVKPGNTAGSLLNIANGNLADARFGVAGTWLRFFTTKRGANTAATNLSAPVAVGYQLVRRATTATGANTDRRYLFHRSEVRANAVGTAANQLGAMQVGYDLKVAAYQPAAATTVVNSPGELRTPTLNSVIAENVIDFGVRLYVYVPNADTGALELRQIFPSSNSDLAHEAKLPPRVANANGDFTDCFPEVVDVMVRILTDDGARIIANYEANPQKITAPQGRTPQQYWWELAVANSQVFTRRIVLSAKPL